MTPANKTRLSRATEVLLWAAVVVYLADELLGAGKALLVVVVTATVLRLVFKRGWTARGWKAAQASGKKA